MALEYQHRWNGLSAMFLHLEPRRSVLPGVGGSRKALEQPTAEYLCTVCDIPLGLARGVRGKGAPVSCFELALGVSGWEYLV